MVQANRKILNNQWVSGGRKAQINKANEFADTVKPIIDEITHAGIQSLSGIARALNARGIPTARGGRWYATSVVNVLGR